MKQVGFLNWLVLRCLVIFCLLVGASSHGQTSTDAVASNETPASEAPMLVANRLVTTFRSPFLGMTAQERARRSTANVDQALDKGGAGRVSSKVSPQGHLVFVDDSMVIILTPQDVDPLSQDTLDAMTARTVQALQLSVKETKESRDARHLLVALGLVGAATLLAACVLWILGRVRSRILPAVIRLIERQTAKLGAGAAEILRRDRLVLFVAWCDRGLRAALALLLGYAWLSFSLLQFPYTRPWGEGLNHYLTSVAMGLTKGMLGAVPGLLIAVVILLIARAAVGILGSLFTRIEQGHVGVRWIAPDSVGPTRRIATWLVWLFALAMAYPYLPGAQTEAFKGMSVLIGLMMSLGASSFVGQVAGGLILTYSSMLRKGEYVRIGEHEGTVVNIGAFNTRIRTGLGEEITLPNSMIVGSATKNYSRAVKGDGYVVDTVVTIGYDTPWRQVHAMLIEAAQRTPGVLADPAPTVFQTSLSDFYPEYRLVCQAIPHEPRPRAEVLANLHANIQDVFNEYGVQIMSPHYVLDPAQGKVVPRDRWFAKPAKGGDLD